MKVRVTLNGTPENPYHRMGLTQNPFPAIADAEPRYVQANNILADLASTPITNVGDLLRRVDGCSQEFVDLCVDKFEPGKSVSFVIDFPE